MRKKVMVVGCGVQQIPTFEAARRIGYETIGIDGAENPFAKKKNLVDNFEHVDIKDYEGALKVAEKYHIDGIVVPGTDFPFTGAFVANKIGIPGIPIHVAELCQNKYLQRKKLKELGYFVPQFVVFNEVVINLIRHKIEEINPKGRFIIKPVDNMGARGVRAFYIQDTSDTELEVYAEIARMNSRSNKFIVEEFIEGPEYSLDVLIYNGEYFPIPFADRHFDLYPYMIETGHTTPSILSKATRDMIIHEFIRVIKDFGITFGVAKGDIKITEHGVMFGEIAARISGGYNSGWTSPLTTGYYPHEDLLRISVGEKPYIASNVIVPKGAAAEKTFLTIPGVIQEIIQTKKVKGIKDICINYAPGDKVLFPYNNASKIGSVIAYSKEGRNEAIFYAKNSVINHVIRLKPDDPETKNFLEDEGGYWQFKPGDKETDWEGRDISFALRQVKAITGIKGFQGISKKFWKYFYKGGVQGGIYYIDTHM